MTHVTVGVIDYGIGNHASVVHSLRDLGFRVLVSSNIMDLERTDILLIPGVGAFPAAMEALQQRGLVDYLKQQATLQRPIVGICLGMQLLTSGSNELGYTPGLNLIPGEVVSLTSTKWHIGWNKVDCISSDPMLQASDGEQFYFNHSFCYQGPSQYQACITHHQTPLVAAIRNSNIFGVQFHPEKSQSAGRRFLKDLLLGLIHA